MTVLRVPYATLLVTICIVVVSLLACESEAEIADSPQPTQGPTHTPVPAPPTGTPYPTPTPAPTYTPVPAPPTGTPYPTPTLSPTATPTPTAILAPPRIVGQTYITTDGLEVTVHSIHQSKTGNVTVIRVSSTVKNTSPDLRRGPYWRLNYQDGRWANQSVNNYPELLPEQQALDGWSFNVQPPDVPASLSLRRSPGATALMDVDGALIWEVGTPSPTATPPSTVGRRPTAVPPPTVTIVPTPTRAPGATATPPEVERPHIGDQGLALNQYAELLAGGPGAIYVGDLTQLAGPTSIGGLRSGFGEVSYSALERNSHLFHTEHYRDLLMKAKISSPTTLTTQDAEFILELTCSNTSLPACHLADQYFAHNVRRRTEGQVNIRVEPIYTRDLRASDGLYLVRREKIQFMEILPAYTGGARPLLDIINVYGLWKERGLEHEANTRLLETLDQGIEERTRGKVVFHTWYGGFDQYVYSNRKIDPETIRGMRVRTNGTNMSYTLEGMRAEPTFVPFAEVYTLLEDGRLDAAITSANAGHTQRWYEVSQHLTGPFIHMPMGFATMTRETWESLPPDLQAIIIEEGAKMELENLRLAAQSNEQGVTGNVEVGMEYLPWSDEMKEFVFVEGVLDIALPAWVQRVGGKERGVWNRVVAPLAGVRIESDGSLTRTGN